MKIKNYIKSNIFKILTESYKWRNRDLIESETYENPKLTFSKVIICNKYSIIISFIISLIVKNLFSENITTFLMTSLSIFIGLFISILILIFDKFLNHNENYKRSIAEKNTAPDIKPNFIRTRNFTRRFIFVLLESLITAFTAILLLLISLIFNNLFVIDIFDYKFIFYKDINLESFYLFTRNTFIVIIKTLVLVLMIRFCLFLFFLLGALAEYMKGVLYGKVNT